MHIQGTNRYTHMGSGPGPNVWEWLDADGCGKQVEIVLCPRIIDGGVYDTNVPKDAFAEALKRATLAGYRPVHWNHDHSEAAGDTQLQQQQQQQQARHIDLKVYRARDMVMETHILDPIPGGPGDERSASGCPSRHKVIRRRILDAYVLPGSPVLACLYAQDRLPFHAFSCGARLHDVRRVRRLVFRLHHRATLVFEVSVGTAVVRGIRVEVAPPHVAHRPQQRAAAVDSVAVIAARSENALRRCVEQAVQAVLMPAAPGAPKHAKRRSAPVTQQR